MLKSLAHMRDLEGHSSIPVKLSLLWDKLLITQIVQEHKEKLLMILPEVDFQQLIRVDSSS